MPACTICRSNMHSLRRYWPAAVVLVAVLAILALEIRPYGYNLTAVFHMDARTATGNPLPQDFVILSIPSYDGAQYYQVARNIPRVMNPARWGELLERNPGSYAYQRFLLPLLSFVLSLGNAAALPFAFVGINIAALVLTSALLTRAGLRPVYAITLPLSPAGMLAMHFTLAEPLTMLLIAFVLLRYLQHGTVGWREIGALCLAVLAREVNILFVLYVMGWSVLTRKWSDMVKLLIPAGVFLAWHAIIFAIFANIPFFTSTGARQLPGSAALNLILGQSGYDAMSLSSLALIAGFLLPGIAFAARDILMKKRADILSLGALAFFGVMLIMPKYIWGSITSIGRVITPVYPLTVLLYAHRNSGVAQLLSAGILALGLATGIGLALILHPYTLS